MANARLSDDEIRRRLEALSEWRERNGKLAREFRFDDFMSAIDFVNRLAPVAEAAGHHPDLQVGWGRVVVELTSHDAGGLTEKDFQLAGKIDGL
jgi:4a-hydroxytetrahydrobiopterin dehydratase